MIIFGKEGMKFSEKQRPSENLTSIIFRNNPEEYLKPYCITKEI